MMIRYRFTSFSPSHKSLKDCLLFAACHIVKNYIAAQLHNIKVPLILGKVNYFFFVWLLIN
jgi:hypothetical protein